MKKLFLLSLVIIGLSFTNAFQWKIIKGKVLDEKMDDDTTAIHSFNQKVNEDSRVENIILPVRDGLLLMRKV